MRRAVHAGYRLGLAPSWRRFARAARDARRAQLGILRRLARDNADTEYGRAHGFADVASSPAPLATWQRRVPVVEWAEVEPFVERVAAGEPRVLTREPVVVMERTSGSSAVSKLVPYTKGLLADFAAATEPWLWNLHAERPALRGRRSYWSISPATHGPERTRGGIPIGFDDDASYFGPLGGWALRQLMAVPGSVARIEDVERWRRETLRHLVEARDLALISVWSPTFLTLLMEALADDLGGVLDEVTPARADEVRRAVDGTGAVTAEALWPELALISCWTAGPSAAFLGELRRWFPRTEIQGKGLLATEGVVSFPLVGHPGAAAAVCSHLIEMEDLDRAGRPPVLLDEVREGGSYAPLLSTSGGLYRYRLGDAMRCVGHYRDVPLLELVGRLGGVSDLCGEKLDEAQVSRALEDVRRELGFEPRFVMLAPSTGSPPAYRLYVETDEDDAAVARAALRVEQALCDAHHYGYCRRLGQLGPVEARRVRDGSRRYLDAQVARGMRAGEVKPAVLDRRTFWAEVFET